MWSQLIDLKTVTNSKVIQCALVFSLNSDSSSFGSSFQSAEVMGSPGFLPWGARAMNRGVPPTNRNQMVKNLKGTQPMTMIKTKYGITCQSNHGLVAVKIGLNDDNLISWVDVAHNGTEKSLQSRKYVSATAYNGQSLN